MKQNPIETLNQMKIDAAAIESIYGGLDRIGALGSAPAAGFSRLAYSNAESDAMRHIESLAIASGLMSRWDSVGNLIVETPGDYRQWVESGSHLDTVAAGGNFDGAAGVVAALAVLQKVQTSELPLKKGLRLRVWRGEESATFGTASIGSRAAFGKLDAAALAATHQGQTLAEAMQSQGADPEPIGNGQPAISQAECDDIAAYLELHIEQGNVLETTGTDIGIVTGIRGSIRSWVKLRGGFDHSGATPMGRPFRRDVNLAMAYMQVRLDELAQKAIAEGQDIVQTVGVINCHSDDFMPEVADNAVTKVSGAGLFSHEVRSISPGQAEAFARQAHRLMKEIAAEHGVEIEIETFSSLPGIEAMDGTLQTLAERCCRDASLSCLHLPSGAWHDAATLCGVTRSNGTAIPVGMLFIPCRGGISHSPEEYASPQQIAAGATVLGRMLLLLACEPDQERSTL